MREYLITLAFVGIVVWFTGGLLYAALVALDFWMIERQRERSKRNGRQP